MKSAFTDVLCVFRIHLARLRAETGPYLLAAVVFPVGMYLFVNAVGTVPGAPPNADQRMRFLAGSIVFSLSLTAISWLGYLLLENRFTGRLRLFATLPLAPSSYVLGILLFAIAQAAIGTASLFVVAAVFGVRTALAGVSGVCLLALTVCLMMLCGCGIAVIISTRARSFSEGSLLTDALGAGLVLMAPIYCAPEALPKALQTFSRILPTTYAAHSVQATLIGRTDVGTDLLMLSITATVTLAVGFRLMRWGTE
jgi:ABC-type multidrug transport system permease subunit